MNSKHAIPLLLWLFIGSMAQAAPPSERQLAKWLKQFPAADVNRDGKLTVEEATDFRKKRRSAASRQGVKKKFNVDPGWDADRFPEHAVSYRTPEEIVAIYKEKVGGNQRAVTSYEKPTDGSLRIVGTGHSFMAPGFQTFPLIARAAGLEPPPLFTHTGGGMTGSTRYKWEQENGIFQFDGKPVPRLLASIANAEWDAMMWGPYFQDRPEYYSCWIDFCLKYNPKMVFYLSDAWPQLDQLDEIPTSEAELTSELFVRLGKQKHAIYGTLIGTLNEKYPEKVFVLPTSDAMVLAVQAYHRDELPGVEGVHRHVGRKERSLWNDRLGHLGSGFGNLEGYVFYATIYGQSPELIEGDVHFKTRSDYPSRELDRMFRQIAWQAVIGNSLSGHTDKNANGISDSRE